MMCSEGHPSKMCVRYLLTGSGGDLDGDGTGESDRAEEQIVSTDIDQKPSRAGPSSSQDALFSCSQCDGVFSSMVNIARNSATDFS